MTKKWIVNALKCCVIAAPEGSCFCLDCINREREAKNKRRHKNDKSPLLPRLVAGPVNRAAVMEADVEDCFGAWLVEE